MFSRVTAESAMHVPVRRVPACNDSTRAWDNLSPRLHRRQYVSLDCTAAPPASSLGIINAFGCNPMTIRVLLHVLTFALPFGLMHCTSAAGATIAPHKLAPRAPADSSVDTGAFRDHRWRLQAGGIAVLERTSPTHYLALVNLDHRWTWLSSHDDGGFASGPLVEIGINLIVPYMKTGIEMRDGKYFFDLHGGVSAFLDFGEFAFPIFCGGCGGYMFKLGDTRMELEAGVNATIIDELVAFPYTTIAIAW
jgi:hypothetical protein